VKSLVYVIDDEADICELVCMTLQQQGFESRAFNTGNAALKAVKEQTPIICIIDLGLPDMDGLTLVRSLFSEQKMGLIILSGRDSLPDKLLGLDLGADDYISKPFEPQELVARVKSISRRLEVKTEVTVNKDLAHFSGWMFDKSTLTLTHENGASFMLSAAEAQILQLFLAAPQQILSRERLLAEDAESFDRSIDVRMSRLRKKLEVDHKEPRIIKTVYGAGYIFTPVVVWQ